MDDGDPYDADPADRFPGLMFHNTKPCNAELPAELQIQSWITPSYLWFIRHHHPVPTLEEKNFRLTVWAEGDKFARQQNSTVVLRLSSKALCRRRESAAADAGSARNAGGVSGTTSSTEKSGDGASSSPTGVSSASATPSTASPEQIASPTGRPNTHQMNCLSLTDLKKAFPPAKVTATIQCGGNRRAGLDAVEKTSGIGWGFGAISNGEFEGVWLRDFLKHAAGITVDTARENGIRYGREREGRYVSDGFIH